MNVTTALAVFSGLMFGSWPLFMNRSNLTGNTASLALGVMTAIMVAPFAWASVGNASSIKWEFVLSAGITSAAGLLCFNSVVAKTTPQTVGIPFVIMVVAQAAVPAIYYMVMNGSRLSVCKVLGFILAIASAVLLTVKDTLPAK